MSYTRVIVVTGSNKGIGKSIVKQLILNADKYKSKNFIVYVTARNLSLGTEVVAEFNRQYKSELEKNNVELKSYKLNISNYDEVNIFKEHLIKNYQGVDILINNAGVAAADLDFNNNKIPLTLQVNFYDTLNMTEAFLPVIKPGGRILTVSSSFGSLNLLCQEAISKFLNKDLTVQKVRLLMDNYIESVRTGTLKENWWPETVDPYNMYKISKIHITAVNFALQLQYDPKQVLVLACCPGYCKTDLNRNTGLRSADEGALTPVFLAFEDIDTIVNSTTQQEKLLGKGVFWYDFKPVPWTDAVAE